VTRLVASGQALFAPGNHDDQTVPDAAGQQSHAQPRLDLTEQQIHALPPHERSALEGDVLTYLASQPPYLVLDGGRLVVAHAGIREDMIGRTDGRVREFCLYGDVRGFEPGTNKPIRHDWAREYSGSALIAYGHTPQAELTWVNNTINLDLGCVFGGNWLPCATPSVSSSLFPPAPPTLACCKPIRPLAPPHHLNGLLRFAGSPRNVSVELRQVSRVRVPTVPALATAAAEWRIGSKAK
jgi:protein phosphatase